MSVSAVAFRSSIPARKSASSLGRVHSGMSRMARVVSLTQKTLPHTTLRHMPSRSPSMPALPGVARLSARWFTDGAFQKRLDKLTGSEASTGNKVELLADGPASYRCREENMRRADMIMAKYFQIDNDEAGRAFVAQLRGKALTGCKVFLQYEVKTAFHPINLFLIWAGLKCPVPDVLKPLLCLPNVALIPSNRPNKLKSLVTARDHEKYILTWRKDGSVALMMGGRNISNSWGLAGQPAAAGDHALRYLDMDVLIEGPMAEAALQEFVAGVALHAPQEIYSMLSCFAQLNKSNQKTLYPLSAQNALCRLLTNRPITGERTHYIEKLYIALLERIPAGETVYLSNAYLLPCGKLRRAILKAADRGVKFAMLSNAPDSAEFEGRIIGNAGHALYRYFLSHSKYPENFRFYEFFGNPAVGLNALHQKTAIFGDNGPAAVASFNLDAQSQEFNKEIMALIYDATLRDDLKRAWLLDVENRRVDAEGRRVVTTRELTPEFLKREPMWKKIISSLLFRLGSRIL